MESEGKDKQHLIDELAGMRRRVAALERGNAAVAKDVPCVVRFEDLFDLEEIQRIQDTFAKATGVASVITDPDGHPLTKPSNSCRLCRDVIRKTEEGLANCIRSDALLGKPNAEGPTFQPCLSCGLWDGGASISAGNRHIANWLVGQIRNERQSEEAMMQYARDIGADETEFCEALAEVTVMSSEQFENVCWALFRLANQLSETAFQNMQLGRMIRQTERAEARLQKTQDEMELRVRHRTAELEEANRKLRDEVNERKRVEEELRRNRERFELAMRGANDGLWDWDLETDNVYFSPRWKSMLGYEDHEIGGSLDEWTAHIHPDDLQEAMDGIKAYQEGRKGTFEVEFRMRHKDGRYVAILSRGFGVRNDAGKIVRLVGTHVDISDRKRAEEELRQHRDHLEELVAKRTADITKINEELEQEIEDRKKAEAERTRLIAILESTSDLVGTITPDGTITYINKAGRNLLGWADDVDMSQRNIPDCHPEHVAKTILDEGLAVAARQGVWIAETVLRHSDGTEIPASQVVMAHKSPDGQVEYFSTIARDITELKQAEEALQLDESRLETLLTLNQKTESSLKELTDFSLEEAIRLTKSHIGYLAFMNEDETVLIMHSWSKTAMEECAISEKPLVYPVVDTGLWGEAVRQRKPIITNDYQGSEPLKKGYPEGHVRIVKHMNIPVFDSDKIVIVAGVGNKESDYVASDVRQLTLLMEGMWRIIQRRRSQQQREELLVDLETKNAELERFTYTVSHDLKSPLITIKGYLGLLQEDLADDSPQAVEDDINRITTAANRMEQLLAELLELSRIGRLNNPPEDVPLAEIAVEAMELVAGQIRQRGVAVEIAPNLPVVYGDRPRLLEVVQNLIDNAVKYMGDQQNPQIKIGARTCDDGAICYVRDNGMGVDPRYHDKIFGLFDQLDQRMHGSGIGLALVKRIVEVHGGRIWLESDGTGKGSTFCFSIPAEAPTTS